MTKVVQRFVCHAASHGTITNNSNDVTVWRNTGITRNG
jgi:hypothetical protein